MNKFEKLAHHSYLVHLKAQEISMQADPDTAYGEGLTEMSRFLGLGGRYDVDDSNAKGPIRGIRSETDAELRNRIMAWLDDGELE